MSSRTKIGTIIPDEVFDNRLGDLFIGAGARVIGILIGFIVWTLLAVNFPRGILPTPSETLILTWNLIIDGSAWVDLSATFKSLFWAFVLAMLLGGGLGILMGLNNYTRNLLTPYVNIGLSIPGLAWGATMFLVFGYTDSVFGTLRMAPVAAATLTVFPYIAINVWKGVENIDHDLIRMADSFGISHVRVLWRIIVPNIAPQVFSALRFGLAIGWKVTIIAEIFAGSSGVGYKMQHAYQVYQYEEAWAWAALFLFVIILIEYGIFKPLERRAFAYRSDVELSSIGGGRG